MSQDYFNPLKMELVKFTPDTLKALRPTSTGQIFDQGRLFHPDGLFSIDTFGRPGTEVRSSTFSRIELNIEIMQPIIYKAVLDLGSIYKKVMEGKEYCVFDKEIGDFIPSSDPRAKTGFNFFMSNFKHIKFKETDSEKRTNAILMVSEAIKRGDATTDNLILIPAGIRDYIDNGNGRPEEDEINTLYRTVISRASLIDPSRGKSNPEIYDDTALGIQKAVFAVYEYVFTLLDGKRKLLQDKWLSRKVFNTSSNVGSSYVDRTKGVDDPRRLKINDVRVGLHQYCRSAAPLSLYHIRNKYIPEIFPDNSNVAYLTNTKTWKREQVPVMGIQKSIARWTTPDGLDKTIASLGRHEVVGLPVYIDTKKEYMLGLLYNDGKYFKFFQDIDDLPAGFDKKYVKPITLFEFIYMCVYSMNGKYPGMITRYPITGYGSIYPAWVSLVTTTNTTISRELDFAWEEEQGDDFRALFFPVMESGIIRTITMHPSHLGAMGGDFDGDTFHLKMLLTDESIKEIKDLLERKDYYFNDQGGLFFSVCSDILESTLKAMF